MLALILAAGLTVLPPTDLLGLDTCPPDAELPPRWEMRAVSGGPAPAFSIRIQANEPVLRVQGRAAAAWAYRRLDVPLASENGRLRWSWRTLASPAGADLSRESGDDAPLRIYVVFGKPKLFGRSRAIFYSWGGDGPEWLERPAFESDRIAVVQVAGANEADGLWRTESVHPFQDYRRFWPGEPPPIRAVGLMQDTDATRGVASAELRALVWEPTPAG